MASPLLTTKLYVPPLRAEWVPRPRLIQWLDGGLRLGHRLSLLSAPAGFGKTSLLSEWVGHLRLVMADFGPSEEQGPIPGNQDPTIKHRVAWLSLDEGDNDPSRFLSYLVAALQTVESDLGQGVLAALQSPGSLDAQAVLASLVSEIAGLPGGLILVLDDYHQIDAPPIHRAVSFLLDHLPPSGPGMHLVIATRAEPPLPTARLRARGQLTEVYAADLRFRPEETAAYLSDVMAVRLSAGQVAVLEERIEGWIAGLQLAALSLRGRESAAGFIQAFAGSHRDVPDFLTEEVLKRQTEGVQSFLLQTSILDRLTGSLCDAVTQGSDSQGALESLEAANLFIVPLDDERRWYRYHGLFAALLRQRLYREHQQLAPVLHRRAGTWFENQGLLPPATSHALAAGDVERAANLIGWTAWTMLTRGEMRAVLGWLDGLPQDMVDSEPQLGILRAWALGMSGQWDGMEWTLGEGGDQDMPGVVAALQAYLASVQGDVTRTISLCGQASAALPRKRWFARSIVALSLGMAYYAHGEPATAGQALGQAIALGRAAGPSHMRLTAMMVMGHVQKLAGSLHQAARTFGQALQLTDAQDVQPLPVAGLAHVGLAAVQYEWNDLERAQRSAKRGIELSELGGYNAYLLSGQARLVELRLARGDIKGAAPALEMAERLAQRHHDAYMAAVLAQLRVRLWVVEGDLAAAAQWLRACDARPVDQLNLAREAELMAATRALLALNEPAEALELLAQLLEAAADAGRMGSLIQILVLQALAFQGQGELDAALSALARALSLAGPEGYIRVFVDEGDALARLLRQVLVALPEGRPALTRGIEPGYVRKLLAAFAAPVQPGRAAPAGLVEPLTGREVEVLCLVAAGLSNREIAAELVVALSTIKTHINHIYGKLDVRNRTQAVARARESGLL